MKFPFYVGDGTRKPSDTDFKLPVSRRTQLLQAEKYLADPGLVDACNVALLLGQPLLLTGEPGTGKTLFAYSLAWELQLGEPLKFETKSTSMARDLFYSYDALRRFQDIQSGVNDKQALDYLHYNALGEAILRTYDPADVAAWLPPKLIHTGKHRSVVLIDEVDKAPRDFPNDILNELEHLYFHVPELDNARITADLALQPIVILTSNSEKDLPDAFLRRCIYYNIPFPNRDRLETIVLNRLGSIIEKSAFLDDALDLFTELRHPTRGLRKKPAIAELLSWLISLCEISPGGINPLTRREILKRSLAPVAKTDSDQARAQEIVQQWMDKRNR
jgi:MoxR-like ATPase